MVLLFLPIYYRDSRRLVFRAFLAFLVLRAFLLSPLCIDPGRRDREARGFLGAPGATSGGPFKGRYTKAFLGSVEDTVFLAFLKVLYSKRLVFTSRRPSKSDFFKPFVKSLLFSIYTL